MARRFVVDGFAVEAGQGVTGAECVVEAVRVLATGDNGRRLLPGPRRVTSIAHLCREKRYLSREASANRRVPIVVELFDPTPSWCCASSVKTEIVASVSWL